MKTTLAYSLLFIVTFAFNYKAISYLLDSSKESIVFVMDCEEEKSEFREVALALLSHSDLVPGTGPDSYRDEPVHP